MADAQAEHHASASRIGDQRRCLGAHVRMAKVDVGNPGADCNPLRRLTHQERGREYVIVGLGRKHC